jgi:hypothetical protein
MKAEQKLCWGFLYNVLRLWKGKKPNIWKVTNSSKALQTTVADTLLWKVRTSIRDWRSAACNTSALNTTHIRASTTYADVLVTSIYLLQTIDTVVSNSSTLTCCKWTLQETLAKRNTHSKKAKFSLCTPRKRMGGLEA